ncbi:hypothetical protein AGABI1DRAFT_128034 [Agaricus bisporus var. burnettii JB137-S8]|uniref:Protein FAF1 n=2 Tax=Agaricus bisporus var. burnettii TaxID=192524 RepID=K5WXX0_AGABU|nr:uncharacterized protein AGABI1DRAFT_128034 [Agaricus bisporus var. burnettii JB137-S8]EKM80361.1 hypothetical protein AGABI1DRAFT_128034 [Agaricus bisporus var. burnettii JB137-S8]KAF7776228.1 hypothetical protein Agabi119p4_4621 [Agaricus bisporus var. burnettii]
MSDQDKLLQVLEAHGEQFLQSFGLPTSGTSAKRKKNKSAPSSAHKRPKLSEDSYSSDEEWTGIQMEVTDFQEKSSELDTDSLSGDDTDFEQEDDGVIASSSAAPGANTIVFSENNYKDEPMSKGKMNSFMSSKVSKIRSDDTTPSQIQKGTPKEEQDEKTNAENDVLLHKLVHTQLLSGSLDPNLNLTPAHRRKALAGRLTELAGGAKMGKGEKTVRQVERNKASKKVREGLAQKQKERDQQQLEEAKNLGNYHPTLKKLFEASGAPASRSRNRGLKMGVGKFENGVLKLSKRDIATVGGKSHSGGKRGRARK